MVGQDQRRDWLNRLLLMKADGNKGAFADMIEINRSSVSLYLSGDRELSDRTVYRIANKLKVPPPKGMEVRMPGDEIVQHPETSSPTTPHEEELAKMLERVLDQNDALVKRLDTQGALLTALWDAVRGNSAVLGEVRAALAQLNEEQP